MNTGKGIILAVAQIVRVMEEMTGRAVPLEVIDNLIQDLQRSARAQDSESDPFRRRRIDLISDRITNMGFVQAQTVLDGLISRGLSTGRPLTLDEIEEYIARHGG